MRVIFLADFIINNVIVLIDQLEIEWKTLELREAVIATAQKCSTPMMSQSLTTVFGLLPVVIAGGMLFKSITTIDDWQLYFCFLSHTVFCYFRIFCFHRNDFAKIYKKHWKEARGWDARSNWLDWHTGVGSYLDYSIKIFALGQRIEVKKLQAL